MENFAGRLAYELLPQYHHNNVVIAPVSVELALLLAAYFGDEGSKTRQELLAAVGKDPTSRNKEVAFEIEWLIRSLTAEESLKLVNTIYADSSIAGAVKLRAYLHELHASIRTEDFSGDPLGAQDRINRLVSDFTHGLIGKALPDGCVDNSTIAILLNALYFKELWKVEFPKENTRLAAWYGPQEEQVSMMSRTVAEDERVLVYKGMGFRTFSLPFKNGFFSFVAILPDMDKTLQDTWREIGTDLNTVIMSMKLPTDEVHISMPRMEMRTPPIDLVHALTSMGIEEAFTPAAQFKAISPAAYISMVIHSAMLKVDESGAEGAAYTAAIISKGASNSPWRFRLDRPYAFAVVHNPSRNIIFAGTRNRA